MSEQIQKIVEARSKVWGHFMIAGQFLDALQFAVSLESLAAELGDEELKATARLLISRSAQEIVDKNQVSKIDKKQDSYNCSFCGSEPPKVRLSRVLKDSQRIGKMIHSRSLIRELDDVWQISIGSDCGAAGSP